MQLQEEKEQQYKDLTTKLDDLQKAKQAEVANLHGQCERLHLELSRANKVTQLSQYLLVFYERDITLSDRESTVFQVVFLYCCPGCPSYLNSDGKAISSPKNKSKLDVM